MTGPFWDILGDTHCSSRFWTVQNHTLSGKNPDQKYYFFMEKFDFQNLKSKNFDRKKLKNKNRPTFFDFFDKIYFFDQIFSILFFGQHFSDEKNSGIVFWKHISIQKIPRSPKITLRKSCDEAWHTSFGGLLFLDKFESANVRNPGFARLSLICRLIYLNNTATAPSNVFVLLITFALDDLLALD